ncbi:MAG TPA: co-chaperone GroES [Candidatus Saccharimonadales bacterium]|jgi:chaperonin GroES
MGTSDSSAIQPLADYVVAQAEEPASKTASGFYLPENAKEKPKTVKVIAVGKDVKQVKAGDRVIYKGYSETSVKVGREEYTLIKEEDIIATVK